jgi:hypothetical protein
LSSLQPSFCTVYLRFSRGVGKLRGDAFNSFVSFLQCSVFLQARASRRRIQGASHTPPSTCRFGSLGHKRKQRLRSVACWRFAPQCCAWQSVRGGPLELHRGKLRPPEGFGFFGHYSVLLAVIAAPRASERAAQPFAQADWPSASRLAQTLDPRSKFPEHFTDEPANFLPRPRARSLARHRP